MTEAAESPAAVSDAEVVLEKALEMNVDSSLAPGEASRSFEKRQQAMDEPQRSTEKSCDRSPESYIASPKSSEAHLERDVTVNDDDGSIVDGEENSKLKRGENSDGDNDSIIDIVSESEVYEAAKQLLSSKPPQIRVNYQGESYLLLGEYDGDNAKEWGFDKIICGDSADLHRGFNIAFGRIRLFLQNVHGGLELLSKELSFGFPDLDLVMEEDNMYNKDITVNDVVSIFKIIKDNSIKKCEPNVSNYLTINVSTKPRFVSRYNSLVEMLNGDATFSNIKVFSNDRSHPVVLDESVQTPNAKHAEVIIMSSEEEKTDNEEANYEDTDNDPADNNNADKNEPNKNGHDVADFEEEELSGKYKGREIFENGLSTGNPAILSGERSQHDTFSLIEDAEKPERSEVQAAENDDLGIGDSLKRRRDSVSDGDLIV
ncbi:LAQU0S14e03246g1_1 [Lachancea quebecensis]|uniref:LAQU0S14e03246g1_1 n=1 Tax=Lachancea quebecensis TaxID=1654605 RepID=A0A0P1KW08_9SACH|nr:LAQU0S14e03246g1_1 [Lachancea quebecensis]